VRAQYSYISPPQSAETADPWAHQAKAAEFLAAHNAALLKIDMGGGKTRIAAQSLAQPHHLPALVITKHKVIEDGIWDRECGRLGLDVLPLTGSISLRANELVQRHAAGGSYVAVTNYEAVWRKPLAECILRIPWRTVIADECHRLKSAGSSVSRFAAKLGTVPHRIGLSGTPMAHSPLDVYGQFRFLDSTIYGSNYRAFRSRYAIMGGYQDHQVIGYQNQDEFMRRFWRITFTAEIDFGLEALDIDLTHELPPAARGLYHELDTEFWAQVGDSSVTIANAAVKVLRLQQLAAGHTRDDEGEVRTVHTARADTLSDWLDDVDPREPVVVFCRFRHDLGAVERVASFLGRPYSEVSGSRNDLTAWKEGQSTILGVQIQAGGEGIDLTRAALAVYYSIGHSLSDYLQSRARLVRPGQTRPVRFYHLSARGTVDAKVYRALAAREDVIQSLLNLNLQGAPIQ
jgi:SNF2 family DNA or RNA helicase